MPGDVLRGHAARAFGEGCFVTRLFFGGEFALRMREEIGAIAAEREHQEQLGVQSRRGNVVRGEAVDGGGEDLLELHRSISPQRHRGTGKSEPSCNSYLGFVPTFH